MHAHPTKKCLIALLGLWACVSHASYASNISTALFQVSPGELTLTRDLLTQQAAANDAWLNNLSRDYQDPRGNNVALLSDLPAEDFSAPAEAPGHEPAQLALAPPEVTIPYPQSELNNAHLLPDAAPDMSPDPGPLAFLGLGLIALALARRRKKISYSSPGLQSFTAAPAMPSTP